MDDMPAPLPSPLTAEGTHAQRALRQRWLLAIGMLALCCLLWGWSFPVAQLAMQPFEAHLRQSLGWSHGDFPVPRRVGLSAAFNTWRMGLAAVLYALLTWRRQRGFQRSDLAGGLLVGTFFAAGMLAQNVGLRYALPSVSGFLTALLVVFAPLAQALIFRRAVGKCTWVAVVLALTGTGILSWPVGATPAAILTAPWPWFGEAMTILGALFFTGQVLALDHFGSRADPARLTLVMLATTAALSGLTSLALGCGALYVPAAVTRLAADPVVWWTLGSLVVFSSVIAMHLMNVYQPSVSPAIASVVYCLEPLFAVAFSLLFQTEHLTGTVVIGGAIILLAVLLVAWTHGGEAGAVKS